MQTSMHGCGASRPPQSRQRQTTTVSAGERGSSQSAAAGLKRRSAERADCWSAWYAAFRSPGPGSVRASSATTGRSPRMRARQAAAALVSWS